MILTEKTRFSTEPSALEYCLLPTGLADVWARKNIERVDDTIDNGPEAADSIPYTYWLADEAYMQTAAAKADLETDPAATFELAAAWNPAKPPEAVPLVDRVEALEALGLDMIAAMMGS